MLSKPANADRASQNIDDRTLLQLYKAMLLPRMIEEKMLLLLRQGKVSKWFSGIGQEAIAVGATAALHDDEFILPLHRNLGVFTSRGLDLEKLFLQLQGREHGFSKGRERSFHFGTLEHRIVGMISHLGPQMGIADGIGLAHRLSAEKKVVLVFCGDGGTSEGDFHEAINVAAVWDLPVIFLIENNGYGLSTPVTEQFRCKQLADRALGYGIEGRTIDGNRVEDVFATVSELAESMRERPRPVMLECMTFRMRGHEEASGVKYVPKELFEQWEPRDPVRGFERRLLERGVLNEESKNQFVADLAAHIEGAVEHAFAAPEIVPDTDTEIGDVYVPCPSEAVAPREQRLVKRRFVDAATDALRISMKRHPKLVLMGQDIAEYGGVFKVTEGLLAEFGAARVRNTPLCESAIVGTALGLSLCGFKAMVEMQFADFVTCGFNQIVNNLAKIRYRWGQPADVVIRMPTGAGVGAGPFHSQSNEAWFAHVAGLKVVYPAYPWDLKGLLLAAFEDPNPVIFFEHKALYRSIDQEIPDDYYTVPIGKARTVRSGDDVTIITYGAAVHWALETLAKYPEISAELLDLRTLLPLDTAAIFSAVSKTGRVIILHEDTLTGGIGGEIAALIAKECFSSLDAPIYRCASLDTPVPFATALEKNFLARSRFEDSLLELLEY